MKLGKVVLIAVVTVFALTATGYSRDLSILEQWKPKFNPKTAQYHYILSNIDHPAIAGIGVGYRIRDKVWQRSGGRLYVDFRPLAQLGGEKDVVTKLKMGAIQGMLCSSVMAANVAPRLGIVSLPFIIDSSAKLEKFRNTPALFGPFSKAARKQHIEVIDFTGYGSYGWATTRPVRSLTEAYGVNFRIAQAPVNTNIYKAWGLKFTVMPWPDVAQALQTGVIDGLDHTPIVCGITKKFEVARYFTDLHYSQGLYIHMVNKRWLDKLPEDLRTIFLDTVREESAIARQETDQQQQRQIKEAQAAGVEFFELNDADRAQLKEMAQPVYEKWGKKIGGDYLKLVQETLK
ncbi:MAG: C4-dicarboxylate ABC transporter substrate-binding protein [Desulfobacteraceae bacterium 4572_35.1]|nr:MAG: C4-dicarboxylate ABC transporter substrate-binding protein [Desulfobacteraceae bacterium 4572_35.1]